MSKSLFAFLRAAVFTAAILSITCFEAVADPSGMPGAAAEKKVVMVVADYLAIEDINRMEFLSRLASESYLALMNNRQAGKAGADKSKLVIGSGKRLELGTDMAAGGSDESSRTLYRMESGGIPKAGSLVYTDIFKLIKRNAESEYHGYIGYLGENIKNNGGITCFIGNADVEGPNRSSMMIPMDYDGVVALGDTENIIKEDRLFPYGRRTDYNKLAELYKQYLAASSFLVVETGDMERLEAFRHSMSEGAYEECRIKILADIDSLAEKLISYGGFNTFIFISTYPSRPAAESGDRLTPLVVFDRSGEGVLYSGNTRRAGIILNTDLADYVLYRLGYSSSSAVVQLKKEKAAPFLAAMNRNIVKTSVLRLPVLTAYAVMIMAAIVVLFTAAVYPGRGHISLYRRLSGLVACTMLAYPLVLLYLPTAFLGKDPIVYITAASAASLAISSMLLIAIKDRVRVFFVICSLQFLGLSIDIIAGSPFIKQSVLGYDPVIGARFYGIGNEYAGMFIGCSLIAFGCLQEIIGNKLGKGVSIVYFLFCVLILGQSLFGANFGGAAAAVSGYLLASFLVYGIKFNKRNISLGILAICAFAVLLILTDSLGMGAPSHLGSLVRETKANGLEVITSTIQRKIAMNLRLIRYTIWTKVLICIIAAIAFMFVKPVMLLGKVFTRYKYLKYSWLSIAAGAIVGFAVNDSGIVLAATAMIYVVFTMLPICIDERIEG